MSRCPFKLPAMGRCDKPEGHDGPHANGAFKDWAHELSPSPYTEPFAALDNGAAASSPETAPEHYRGKGMEPWDVVDAFGLDYYRGSALKYILRAGRKGPAAEDLRKAIHFLRKALELEENRTDN
ncbi:hypothetical protein BJP40_06435 [Streptomyces sp. CC53]|uniref:DUF3310 domain-containing protein n=1 Tax=Streptomyces sp. CC53 TaxID=1906740 RepID=UPI0008DD12E6|nr:DUF3310 domain-containing protein [Streptomyces sp. CC53]OII61160.1 hypothetical protein BJP40_06435 [Streptomyces sp. CC53]